MTIRSRLRRLSTTRIEYRVRDLKDKALIGQKLKKATPVIVYQMGKVGSSSVYRSLQRQYAGAVAHAHSFSPTHKDGRVRRLYQWTIREKHPLNVITLTREPIGRNVSSFFQNFARDTGVPFVDSCFSTEQLRALFLKNYTHQRPLEWFDKSILTNFGIDVFATPFPDTRAAIYTRDEVRLLVLRAESNDEEKSEAICSFLGLDCFRITNENIGDNKEYAGTYRAFQSTVKLPEDYVEAMCASKYFNHFYSEKEINAVRMKWSSTA